MSATRAQLLDPAQTHGVDLEQKVSNFHLWERKVYDRNGKYGTELVLHRKKLFSAFLIYYLYLRRIITQTALKITVERLHKFLYDKQGKGGKGIVQKRFKDSPQNITELKRVRFSRNETYFYICLLKKFVQARVVAREPSSH